MGLGPYDLHQPTAGLPFQGTNRSHLLVKKKIAAPPPPPFSAPLAQAAAAGSRIAPSACAAALLRRACSLPCRHRRRSHTALARAAALRTAPPKPTAVLRSRARQGRASTSLHSRQQEEPRGATFLGSSSCYTKRLRLPKCSAGGAVL